MCAKSAADHSCVFIKKSKVNVENVRVLQFVNTGIIKFTARNAVDQSFVIIIVNVVVVYSVLPEELINNC